MTDMSNVIQILAHIFDVDMANSLATATTRRSQGLFGEQ